MDVEQADDIISEIINAQKTGVLSGVPVRELYEKGNRRTAAGYDQASTDAYVDLQETQYLQTPEELSADLFAICLFDPAYAKRVMPNASRMVRKLMNNSKTVTFYSMPLASLVAAILANMMVAEGEEEEKRGLLSLGQGALSA